MKLKGKPESEARADTFTFTLEHLRGYIWNAFCNLRNKAVIFYFSAWGMPYCLKCKKFGQIMIISVIINSAMIGNILHPTIYIYKIKYLISIPCIVTRWVGKKSYGA